MQKMISGGIRGRLISRRVFFESKEIKICTLEEVMKRIIIVVSKVKQYVY